MKTYPNLSKPIQIGKVTIKNRMFMAPMDTGFGNTPDGIFTPEGVEYFVRRAQEAFRHHVHRLPFRTFHCRSSLRLRYGNI